MPKATHALVALVTISIGLSLAAQRPTSAFPKYMKAEGLSTCGYCHTKDSGGGARNYRGAYYQMHNHSFAGFDDAAEAKTAGTDVAPHGDLKPSSMTPAAAPAAPAAPEGAAPAKAPAAKTGSALAADKAHAAKLAYQKSPKDAKLKASYVSSMAALTHAYLGEKRYADTQTAAKSTLALDPKNAGAKSDLAAATAAQKKK